MQTLMTMQEHTYYKRMLQAPKVVKSKRVQVGNEIFKLKLSLHEAIVNHQYGVINYLKSEIKRLK